jgi:hypothetical protein
MPGALTVKILHHLPDWVTWAISSFPTTRCPQSQQPEAPHSPYANHDTADALSPLSQDMPKFEVDVHAPRLLPDDETTTSVS